MNSLMDPIPTPVAPNHGQIKSIDNPTRKGGRWMCCLLAAAFFCCTFAARAAVSGVTQCSDTNFTIQVSGFPNATIVAQFYLNPSGEVILAPTFNFGAQTLVAVRPANLPGGTYTVNFYANGVWFTQAQLTLCNRTGQVNGGVPTNLFPVIFKAVCVSTNSRGLVYRTERNSDLIRDCAMEHSITNISNLRLVYNRTNDSLDVIGATNQFNTNQTVICTALSFENGTSLTNTNNTVVERLSFVFVGTNQVASGTLTAKETFTYGSSNQLTSFRLVGSLAYTVPASGTNSAEICRGLLVTGTGSVTRHDDDDDDDHDGDHDDDDNDGDHHGDDDDD